MAFLFGATSILGQTFLRLFPERFEPFCSEHSRWPLCQQWRRLNLEDGEALASLFATETPELLVHCGAVCDVEKCERWPEFATRVNVTGVERLLDHLPASTRLVYCSSDHVFSGDSGPYTEASEPDPISEYGRARVRAEQLIRERRSDALILRMGPAIGPSLTGQTGHLDWLRFRHARGLPISIVHDEVRSVVWAEDLARRVVELAASDLAGVRHVVAERPVSREVLAAHLNERFAIGASYRLESRSERSYPHLGQVELHTRHHDPLAAPLPAVVPTSDPS
jgi:dTDP-4-dehydrorhamnose reductase